MVLGKGRARTDRLRIYGRGFTLIELLVVIAIIAILAAVLFPVVTSAKAKGNQTMCASNMRQVTTALVNYADDWNGWLPGLNVFGDLVEVTSGKMNKGPLWQYVKTKQVFCCPVDMLHRNSRYRFTYTINGYMTVAEESRSKADKVGVPTGKSKAPSRTILLVDENTDPRKSGYIVNDALFIGPDRDRPPRVQLAGSELNGLANVCYIDTLWAGFWRGFGTACWPGPVALARIIHEERE